MPPTEKTNHTAHLPVAANNEVLTDSERHNNMGKKTGGIVCVVYYANDRQHTRQMVVWNKNLCVFFEKVPWKICFKGSRPCHGKWMMTHGPNTIVHPLQPFFTNLIGCQQVCDTHLLFFYSHVDVNKMTLLLKMLLRQWNGLLMHVYIASHRKALNFYYFLQLHLFTLTTGQFLNRWMELRSAKRTLQIPTSSHIEIENSWYM